MARSHRTLWWPLALGIAGLTASACRNATTPSPFEEPFTIAPHMVASIGDNGLTVEFQKVEGDSRCPADVVCIQGGDAIVHVRVADKNGSLDAELHTGDSSRAIASYRDYTITLVDLHPYPFSGKTTDQKDYRATLRVSRK